MNKEVKAKGEYWKATAEILKKWREDGPVNALDYKSLESEEHEWDNVPMLVSHFIIHLEKYIRALSKNASRFSA